MIIFKKGGCMRKNPLYRTSEMEEQIKEIEASVKRGTCILSADNLHPSKMRKKRLFSELGDSSSIVACKKSNLLDERCKKAASRSKFHTIEEDVVDNTMDDDNFDEADGERSVDGDESVTTDTESQENEEGSNISSDLYQKERLQNMNYDHTLSPIPSTERKK